VDKKKYDLKTDNKFVISGSCSYLLKKEYSTLLTGRNLTFEVTPLSLEEALLFKRITIDKKNLKNNLLLDTTKTKILKTLDSLLEQGSFPEVFLKQKKFKSLILKQYFDDILYKDILGRYNFNSQKTKDLVLYLITNITNIFFLMKIRNSVHLSYYTAEDYLVAYKEAYLLFTLEKFSYSLKQQKKAPSKIYCIDNGLRNAVSFKYSTDAGKLAENLVFIELIRRDKETYYWKGQNEVDFVVKNSDNSLEAINVCYSNEIHPQRIKRSYRV